MLQFIIGFIIALLVVLPFLVMLDLRKNHAAKKMLQREILVSRENHKNATRSSVQLEELGKLTGQLAHEIKNPLSTIKINLQLIGEELKELSSLEVAQATAERDNRSLKRTQRKVAVIEKETDRLEQILEGFLRYLDRTELQLVSIDINELVGDMVDFYSPQAQGHRIVIHQALTEQPLICRIDADMLKQVLLNLLINAQHAMSNGGELLINTERQGEYALIRISDTGCGIPSDKLGLIFDAYYSSTPHGSGLGLPTAKKIIESHAGTITVDSEVGKGTSFTIRLPLKQE